MSITSLKIILRKALVGGLFICFSCSILADGPIHIKLYTYHFMPPFIIQSDTGVAGATNELVDILNEQAAGGFLFKLTELPRPRLNQELGNYIRGECATQKCEDNWVLPWVNPSWGFTPEGQTPYALFEQFDDANSVYSHIDSPFEYEGVDSAAGKSFVGIRGHRYVDLDESVKTGAVDRVDANTDLEVLSMLLARRVEFALLPKSGYQYLKETHPVIKKQYANLHVSKTPHQAYTRFLMVPSTNTGLAEFLQRPQTQNSLMRLYSRLAGE